MTSWKSCFTKRADYHTNMRMNVRFFVKNTFPHRLPWDLCAPWWEEVPRHHWGDFSPFFTMKLFIISNIFGTTHLPHHFSPFQWPVVTTQVTSHLCLLIEAFHYCRQLCHPLKWPRLFSLNQFLEHLTHCQPGKIILTSGGGFCQHLHQNPPFLDPLESLLISSWIPLESN